MIATFDDYNPRAGMVESGGDRNIAVWSWIDEAETQAMDGGSRRRQRTVIAAHLIHTLYGHWAVNDPRGSGSRDFIDRKFEPLGPIHHGRKPRDQQPSREELRAFHAEHKELLNFPLIWVDEAKAQAIAEAMGGVIGERKYTCYACAICSNHMHLVIRTHRDKAPAMWSHFAEGVRQRLRHCFSSQISPHHPVISARPYNVLLYSPDEVWGRIGYVEKNPLREGLPMQRWGFVTPYDNWPLHKQVGMRSRDGE
jgi:REP element-mobilizing transposase RayT